MTEATAFALIAPTIPLALLATYALHGLTVRIARAYLRRQKMTIAFPPRNGDIGETESAEEVEFEPAPEVVPEREPAEPIPA